MCVCVSARCFWTAQGRGHHRCSRTGFRPTTQQCSSFPRVCVCSHWFCLSVCATISGVIRLCAPSSSLMPLWGPRDPCGSSSTGQDRCVCVCVFVRVFGGGGVCMCVAASSVGGYASARWCWVCCQQAWLLEGVMLYLPPLLVSWFIHFLFEVYIPVNHGKPLAGLTLV